MRALFLHCFFFLLSNILKALDKMDGWTPRQVQTILERMICTIAGLGKNVQTGNPRAGLLPLVKAFREFGGDLTRGEPWEQAKKLLEAHDVPIPSLAKVDHDFTTAEAEEQMQIPMSPTLFTRMTRARRAAYENRDVARKSLREASVSDIESDGDDLVKTAADARSRRSARNSGGSAPTKTKEKSKRAFVLEDEDDEDDEADEADYVEEEEEPALNARRSNRNRRLQEESEDEEQANKSKEGDDDDDAKSQLTDLTQESSADAEGAEAQNGKAGQKSPQEKTPEPAAPLPMPHFEERIGILSALVEVVLADPAVNKDLRTSADEMVAVEKDSRVAVLGIEKQFKEQMEELQKHAPSFANQSEAFQEWKKKVSTGPCMRRCGLVFIDDSLNLQKAKAEADHKWALLETNVAMLTSMQRLKLRTGPLGVDVDGREYWQLIECEHSFAEQVYETFLTSYSSRAHRQ